MKKDFLSIQDLSLEEIYEIFELADELRNIWREKKGEVFSYQPLQGKTLALIFDKPSTRTRVSFEVAAYHLGAHPVFLSAQDIHLGKSESLEDTARVISKYVDAVVIRTFGQEKVEKFAAFSDVPVINALSDLLHPCQALSDYYTLYRRKKLNQNIKFSYVGDGNNVCHSLILGAAKLKVNLIVATPEKYKPKPFILKEIKEMQDKIKITQDPKLAVDGADVIYTDVWVSMGQEKEKKEKKEIFRPYQVNSSLLSLAKPDALVMHCLPAHRGEEITDEVIDGKNSIVLEQAENRLHIQKALLVKLMKG
ncbi:ornithine carbamoyltransferase [Candidatus Aerophobetes bacterium]|nr:ornithine carbamoyltransferase [Candidatus Aerophobetes bacterium]